MGTIRGQHLFSRGTPYCPSTLRTVKMALNLLFVTRKLREDIALVYGNRMAAECRLLRFVIIILTVSLF